MKPIAKKYKRANILWLFFLLMLPSVSFCGVKLNEPSPSDSLVAGKVVRFSWEADEDAFSYSLFCSSDGGDSWFSIAENIFDTEYFWEIPFLQNCKLMLKVVPEIYSKPYLIIKIDKAHDGEIVSSQFTSNGREFFTASKDGWVKFWSSTTFMAIDSIYAGDIGTIYSGCCVQDVNSNADCDSALIAIDTAVYLWVRSAHSLQRILDGYKRIVKCVASNNDGQRFAAASYDGSVSVFSFKTTQVEKKYYYNNNLECYAVNFSVDGKYLSFCGFAGTVYVCDIERGDIVSKFSNDASTPVLWSVDISPDSKHVASGGTDNIVRTWNIATGAGLLELSKHSFHIRAVRYHPKYNAILSAGLDSTFIQWHSVFGLPLGKPTNSFGQIISAGYSPSGDTIITVTRDGKALLSRNFTKSSPADSITFSFRYPVYLRLPDTTAYVGETIEIPFEVAIDSRIPEKYLNIEGFKITFKIPNTLLHCSAAETSQNEWDSIVVLLPEGLRNGVNYSYKALVLPCQTCFSVLPYSNFSFYGGANLELYHHYGSITVLSRRIDEPLVASPNPSFGESLVQLFIEKKGYYDLDLITIKGQFLMNIVSSELEKGYYEYLLNMNTLASGSYFLRLSSGSEVKVYRLILLR